MIEIEGKEYEGERPLYNLNNAVLNNVIFNEGESPLKECSDLKISNTTFKWKYPMWYSKNIYCENIKLIEVARSGIWYTKNITIKDSDILVPKTFRRCDTVNLLNVNLPEAMETFWNCKNINIKNVKSKGTYFGMNSENIFVENFDHNGDYLFDGAKNIEVHNAKIISKDSFWNCENVVIYNSYIEGEYFGWNSKNIKLVNCTIDSNQGLCYIDGLEMENCVLNNCNLSFELCSDIKASISSHINSVKNPKNGIIKANSIGEIIFDEKMVDKSKTIIEVENV